MTRNQRKLIQLAFAAVFLLAAPVAILSTAGYRYNWAKGQLEKTGIIKFVSKPSGAHVWLNGRLLPRTTPVSEFRLLPEDYDIRIEKPGYFEWKKKLEVKSGETTFTEDVYLVQQTVPRRLADADWLAASWDLNGRRLALVRQGAGGEELAIISSLGQEEALLARLAPKQYQDIRLSWSPDGRNLLFQADRRDEPTGRTLIVYPLPPTEMKPTVLSTTADDYPAAPARWTTDGRGVTALLDGTANLFDLSTARWRAIPGTAGADDILKRDRQLFLVKTSDGRSQILSVDPDGQERSQELADLPMGRWRIALAEGDYLLFADQRSGQSVLFRLSDNEILGPWNGRYGAWEKPDGQGRLMIWNDFEIAVWNPETGKRQVVTRLSTPIGQCLWDPSGRNVLFAAGDSLLAAELDSRDGRNIYQLNRLTSLGPISLDPAGQRVIRFLGTAGSYRSLFQQGF